MGRYTILYCINSEFKSEKKSVGVLESCRAEPFGCAQENLVESSVFDTLPIG